MHHVRLLKRNEFHDALMELSLKFVKIVASILSKVDVSVWRQLSASVTSRD
jgi:hypothetical protein